MSSDYSRHSRDSSHHHHDSRYSSDSAHRHRHESRERVTQKAWSDISENADFDEEFEAATPLQSVRIIY